MLKIHSSRRSFGKLLLAGIPAAWALAEADVSRDGVRIGVCTYSFRDMPRQDGDAIPVVIQAVKECDANIVELFSPQVEPDNPLMTQFLRAATKPDPGGKPPSMDEIIAKYRAAMETPEAKKYRQELRQWRLTTPMSHFDGIRKQFDDAGIELYAYTLNFSNDFTDEELEKCFEQAKALRVHTIASSTQLSMLPRLMPLAEKHKVYVALHGHDQTTHADEFSTPESFQRALDKSPWFMVNLDIGHFTAANFDSVSYIRQHHDRITHLHFKDRKRNHGANEPFGEGDTPMKDLLLLLKQQRYPIPALVEYEYPGNGSPVDETKKCLAYMNRILQTG